MVSDPPKKEQAIEFATPMMLQYAKIKEQYSDCILLFRLGDFYEMFMDDAKLGASILDIALTSRDRGKDGRVPMAGIPFHALDSYVSKFTKAGHKVAICEQIGDTAQPGLVERDVVRVITPGTLLEENVLDRKENNFILAIHVSKDMFGIAFADISTGIFQADEYDIKQFNQVVSNGLAKYNPSECLLPPVLYNDAQVLKLLRNKNDLSIFPFFDWDNAVRGAEEKLQDHFNVKNLSSFGMHKLAHAQKAACALLAYLKYALKSEVPHIKKMENIQETDYMVLDRSTIYNLELFTTMREGKSINTVLDYMDKTVTPMGARMLRQWMIRPLLDIGAINNRYDAVELLMKNLSVTGRVKDLLREILDMERIVSRLSVGTGNPRDLVNLAQSVRVAGELKDILEGFNNTCLSEAMSSVNSDFININKLISDHIIDIPPFDPKSGGFIKDGINSELDDLRKRIESSKKYLSNLETRERQLTGINSLKVRFNQVFGYYIEITKANLSMVPSNYVRKQTMVNAERFVTPELKEHEEVILTAEERLKEIEYAVFSELVAGVLENTSQIQAASSGVATVDCLAAFALLADENQLVRPEINDTRELIIKAGRHPVVEKSLPLGEFITNDVALNDTDNQLLVVTGPNMAGKSVFIRQVAVIVLMAQMGCFVPAEQATIGIVDRLFVRSGASDVISAGLSTFMVEMTETAYILNNCTDRSLIIMDEIGRGTSTYDGISIAWSVAEYLVSKTNVHPKTLFATHYHELQQLEQVHPKKIKNLQVLVEDTPEGPVFLHKVAYGAAKHSYGIEVAKLAGVPPEVYKNALKILARLKDRASETSSDENKLADLSKEVTPMIPDFADLDSFLKKTDELDISSITPLEALNMLSELKQIYNKTYNNEN